MRPTLEENTERHCLLLGKRVSENLLTKLFLTPILKENTHGGFCKLTQNKTLIFKQMALPLKKLTSGGLYTTQEMFIKNGSLN
jgi:hypothetical protein